MPDAVTLRLIIDDPVPGVRYSLQKDDLPFEPRTAGDGPMTFEVSVTLHPDGRLTGPFVRREGAERRFVHIRIGTSAGDHASAWSRRAKIDIHDIPAALRLDGAVLEARLPGRGRDGSPACATVRRLGDWKVARRR
jgi:hypothetical protein